MAIELTPNNPEPGELLVVRVTATNAGSASESGLQLQLDYPAELAPMSDARFSDRSDCHRCGGCNGSSASSRLTRRPARTAAARSRASRASKTCRSSSGSGVIRLARTCPACGRIARRLRPGLSACFTDLRKLTFGRVSPGCSLASLVPARQKRVKGLLDCRRQGGFGRNSACLGFRQGSGAVQARLRIPREIRQLGAYTFYALLDSLTFEEVST